MKCKKRIISGVICAIIAFGSLAASAEWIDAGYDTTTPPNYFKIQNEVLYGKNTSNFKQIPVKEEDVKWVKEGYELEYPHIGYDRLYLEGHKQVITRYNALYPQWETRYRDFMWELCGDHTIWQRQQTKIPNIGWKWDFGNEALGISDFEVFVPTNRTAEVKYLDGKMAYDEVTGEPITRKTGEFGNAYIKVTSNEIQLWVKDERGGDEMVDAISRTDANYGGYATGYINGTYFVN